MPTQITSINVAQAISKLVANDALPALENTMIMGQLINRDYQATMQMTGDVVNVPIPGVMQANNIAEGGSVTPQNPALGNAQIVLNVHAEATFIVPDVTKVIAFPELLRTYMQPAVIAVGERVEQDILNLYANLTANPFVGTGGAGLGSESVIDQAEKQLFKAKVPQAIQKYLVVGADAYSDLRQIPRFSEKLTNGDGEAIVSGQIGILKGFEIYRHTLIPQISGTTYNVAFAPDAMTLVTRMLPQPLPGTGAIAEYVDHNGFGLRVVMSYAPNTLAQQFTVDVLYGVAILRNVFGIQVLS